MRKPNPRPKRNPWELNTLDYAHEKVYAQKRTMRYELFFNYLRISPSYFLALECESEEELAKKLGDVERATRVWNTRKDVGNVYEVMFKEWWMTRGINLFGVHTRRPKAELITFFPGKADSETLTDVAMRRFQRFVNSRFDEQGRPNSVLVSIPLGQTRIKTSKEIYELITRVEEAHQAVVPAPKYELEKNKIQDHRLHLGSDVAFFKMAFPGWEWWRVGARVKVSKKHMDLAPLERKKGAHNEEARRGLTLITSRMFKETMIIAENAATGRFPCLDPIKVAEADTDWMGQRLSNVHSWEKDQRQRMLLEANRT